MSSPTKPKRPRKIKYGGATWNRRLGELAHACIRVVVCTHCGSPASQGYMCFFCGEDPGDDQDE